MKPTSSKTSTDAVQQDASPTNPIREARKDEVWSKAETLRLLNESNCLLHAFGITKSPNYIGISTYNDWENGTQPRKEHALLLCELFGKSCNDLGLRRKMELAERSKLVVLTSPGIFNAAKADGFASAFSLFNNPLLSGLPSSFASYGPSHFNTLYNALMEKASSPGNHRNLISVFQSCIHILQKRLKTAPGEDEKALLRALHTFNASAIWVSLAAESPTTSYAHVKEAMIIAIELNIPWLKYDNLCKKSILAHREKKWKDMVIFAKAAQKYGNMMHIRLYGYALLLQAVGYSLLRDKENFHITLEEVYCIFPGDYAYQVACHIMRTSHAEPSLFQSIPKHVAFASSLVATNPISIA